MTPEALIAFYEKRAEQFRLQIQNLTTEVNIISNLRLATAIASLLLLYFGFKNNDLLYILPLFLIIFLVLVKRHTLLFDRRTHLQHLLLVQENELHGLNSNHTVFEKGSEFIDTHHDFSYDLDVFGDGSLFEYLNRSKNHSGKNAFAARLQHPILDKDYIHRVQEAVRELATQTEFRHTFQAFEKEVDEQPADKRQLSEWLESKSILSGRFIPILITALPIITVLLMVFSVWVGWVFYLFLGGCAIQWVITGLYSKRIQSFHYYISNKKNILEKYARMLKCVSEASFRSAILVEHKRNIHALHLEVQRLASLVGVFDARLNWLTYVVVNSVLLFDLQCVYRLEQWKKKNGQMLSLIDRMHEIEVLCSYANFSFNNPEFIFPQISTDKFFAKSMAHPLISAAERVANDFEMDGERSVVIITGANMAGKSTFLRTIGVNYLLAVNGAPTCASDFVCPTYRLRTGMRTADSLHDHQSYFYAELNRLKSIVDQLKAGEKLFVLLDEILKGTNSNDKQAGSIALVKQLVKFNALTIIATHDLALGNLEKEHPVKVRNFCFEPSLENDYLHFDYTLKQGVATKMNATFLMRKMGIIPEG